MASTRLPSSMRAAQWTHVSSTLDKALHINPSAPLPLAKGSKTPTQLPPKHTLVRVAYASVNPIDIKLPALPIVGRLMFHKPATPGLDFSGTVVATSSDGTLAPGTRVYGKLNYPAGGALAEYLLVDSHKATICPLPDGVSLRDAGVLGTATAAAYHGLVPYLQTGQHVLINGASGGVGTIAVQFAKAIGCRVTAVCSGANADMVRRLGADEVIDYRQEQPAAQLKRLGAQFDHIFDAAYHDTSLYYQAHHYLKTGGQYVNIAGNVSLKGLKDFLVPTLLPSWLGGGQRKLVFFHGDATLESLTRVAQWVAEKKVQPVIDQQFNLEDISAAYRQLATGRSKGKIAIKISDDQ